MYHLNTLYCAEFEIPKFKLRFLREKWWTDNSFGAKKRRVLQRCLWNCVSLSYFCFPEDRALPFRPLLGGQDPGSQDAVWATGTKRGPSIFSSSSEEPILAEAAQHWNGLVWCWVSPFGPLPPIPGFGGKSSLPQLLVRGSFRSFLPWIPFLERCFQLVPQDKKDDA